MLMRFYWGLGVGHTYSHGEDFAEEMDVDDDNDEAEEGGEEEGNLDTEKNLPEEREDQEDECSDSNSNTGDGLSLDELGFNDKELDPWYDSSGSDGEDGYGKVEDDSED